MVKNDLQPSVEATLKRKDGTIVDLTGCTVKFHMRSPEGILLIDESAVIVSPPTSGKVRYDWQAARDTKPRDTNVVGSCKAEFEVVYPDGATLTFPAKGDFYIHFREEYA